MSPSNLRTALNALRSDKIKDRTEGLQLMRDIFSDSVNVSTLDDGDGRAWLNTFQSLFVAVVSERTYCIKNSAFSKVGGQPVKRLIETAATVRWLVEKAVTRINRRVVKALFTHLIQILEYQGELFSYVASDYLKALRLVLAYPPHLAHLDERQWVTAVSFCFAGLLGENVKASLEALEEPDAMDIDANDDPPSMSSGRKRRCPAVPESSDEDEPVTTARSGTPASATTLRRTVRQEDIEFAACLDLLCRSPLAPFVEKPPADDAGPQPPSTSRIILTKFVRLFSSFSAETTVHQDAVRALNGALIELELNVRDDVSHFGVKLWPLLVALWPTKNKALKEQLVISFRLLLPFVARREVLESNPGFAGEIWALHGALFSEHENGRWALEPLDLAALRFELPEEYALGRAGKEGKGKGPAVSYAALPAFCGRTVRFGFHFGAAAALTWAALELTSDCLATAFALSENIAPTSPSMSGRSVAKRRKMENPIDALLLSILPGTSVVVRVYRLQILLFVIERQFDALHRDFKIKIRSTLLQLLADEDGGIQTWSFICLAALAAVDDPPSALPHDSSPSMPVSSAALSETSPWEQVWTYALRRLLTPTTTRAACHAGNVLLATGRVDVLKSLNAIEPLLRDLDIQGPAFPYDSVCAFLGRCLHAISRDARLFRMALEDKVLNWLSSTWSVVDGTTKGFNQRSKLEPHTPADLLTLLAYIARLPPPRLCTDFLLPDCAITARLLVEHRTGPLREFILYARLSPASDSSRAQEARSRLAADDVIEPPPIATKSSTFLQRSLEALDSEWNSAKHVLTGATPEKIRRSLDLVILALSFEAHLGNKGYRASRRTIQAACKLVGVITPCLAFARWPPPERALILQGLAPLFTLADDAGGSESESLWPVLLQVGPSSGVRKDLEAAAAKVASPPMSQRLKGSLQNVIWTSSDVHTAFAETIAALRTTLSSGTTPVVAGAIKVDLDAMDDDDDFGRQNIAVADAAGDAAAGQAELPIAVDACVSLCVRGLAHIPLLQSTEGGATRDKEMLDALLTAEGTHLISIGRHVLDAVQAGTLHLSTADADAFLDAIQDTLMSYEFGRRDETLMLALRFLEATLAVWTRPSIASTSFGSHVRQLCHWFCQSLFGEKIKSWAIRLHFAKFLDQYLLVDPPMKIWEMPFDMDDEGSIANETFPSSILPMMASDADMRVRFRVATSAPRLFDVFHGTGDASPYDIYDDIQTALPRHVDIPEFMLTRALCLANVLIGSGAVAKTAYYHLIEITTSTKGSLDGHVHALTVAVSRRLGLDSPARLWTAFASQMASMCRENSIDFTALPSLPLGFSSRKAAMQAAFRQVGSVALGFDDRKAFQQLCKMVGRPYADGLRDCLPLLLARQIVSGVGVLDESSRDYNRGSQELFDYLIDQLRALDPQCDPEQFLSDTLDEIALNMLALSRPPDEQSLGIFDAMTDGGATAKLYRSLTRRSHGAMFEVFEVSRPSFTLPVVVRALHWLSTQYENVLAEPTVYHISHQLINLVGTTAIVNEQLRYLYALCLLVVLSPSACRDPVILRTLLHGASVLHAQRDIAEFAANVLRWAVDLYITLKSPLPEFPDILALASNAAASYSRCDDPALSEHGRELLDWLEGRVGMLLDVDELASQARDVLPYWPRAPQGRLAESGSLDLDEFADVLARSSMRTSKFLLVRALRDAMVRSSETERIRHGPTIAWHLKAALPRADELRADDADIEALVELVHLCDAKLRTPDIRTLAVLAAPSSSGRRGGSKSAAEPNDADVRLKMPFVQVLVDMLRSDDLVKTEGAYRTLRCVITSTSGLLAAPGWPEGIQKELVKVQAVASPPEPPAREVASLAGLIESEAWIADARVFESWIRRLAALFADFLGEIEPFYAYLRPLIGSTTSFASRVLVHLVQALLSYELFHAQHFDASGPRSILSSYFSSLLSDPGAAPDCVRAVIDVLLHLRHHVPPKSDDPLAYNRWLAIDFFLLARSAANIGAYTTALLFLELANEDEGRDAAARYADQQKASEDVLYDIYANIDDPDGFYSIQSRDVRSSIVRRLHHEGQWRRAFEYHGSDYESGIAASGAADAALDIVHSLHSFGFDKLAVSFLQAKSSAGSASGVSYELGWRTETWDLPVDTLESTEPDITLYSALRAIHRERDGAAIQGMIKSSVRAETLRFASIGQESATELRQVTRNLAALREVLRWANGGEAHPLDGELSDDLSQVSTALDFPDLEKVLATRMSLLRAVKDRELREQLGDTPTSRGAQAAQIERACLLRLSSSAREQGNPQAALNAITLAQRVEVAARLPAARVEEEFANVLWLQNERTMAISLLRNLLPKDELRRSKDNKKRSTNAGSAQALLTARLADWLSAARLERAIDIETKYFGPASEFLASSGVVEEADATVFHQYAVFAEKQYRLLKKSPEFDRLRLYYELKNKEIKDADARLSQRASTPGADYNSIHSARQKAARLRDLDREKLDKHEDEMATFLGRALEMYAKCLSFSDAHDDDAIRLISLWLSSADDEVNETMAALLDAVPTHKFVFLAHQLCARLSKASAGSAKFQHALQALLYRLCVDHPFHTLYHVYALRQGQSGPTLASSKSRRASRGPDGSASQAGRAQAAVDLFARVQSQERLTQKVRALEALCQAYIQFAMLKLHDRKEVARSSRGALKSGPHPLLDDIKLKRVRDVPVPVITDTLPIDRTGQYADVPTIRRYADTFTLAGGLHVPRIIDCISSTGKRYKQLFKGEDDLRQDAVMEQVFGLVNSLLERDRQTRRRSLHVRTYKVIPLASQAGVLEFVENTMAMNEWLLAAHPRYRPKDWTPLQARNHIKAKQTDSSASPAEKLRAWLEVKQNIQPVLRHFFSENHKLPTTWFAMRLNYSRSVAVTSIVGHILGLGDRHVSNILMDKVSGEVVHIDLGIAFDQGRLLPIPELVPFRLTRDIVDGMGSSGVAGVFTRCAEETLRVLRDSAEIIMTVLEVFRADPLHTWTANPLKLLRMQSETGDGALDRTTADAMDPDSGPASEQADRALMSVSLKLSPTLSVQQNVAELIQQAQDDTALATIYTGWQAAL